MVVIVLLVLIGLCVALGGLLLQLIVNTVSTDPVLRFLPVVVMVLVILYCPFYGYLGWGVLLFVAGAAGGCALGGYISAGIK